MMTGTPDRVRVASALEHCARNDCDDTCAYRDKEWSKAGLAACRDFADGDTVEVPGVLLSDALMLISRPPAVWQYYTNDEGKARWRCSECGKICRRDPRDKKFCSACGAEMRMEA